MAMATACPNAKGPCSRAFFDGHLSHDDSSQSSMYQSGCPKSGLLSLDNEISDGDFASETDDDDLASFTAWATPTDILTNEISDPLVGMVDPARMVQVLSVNSEGLPKTDNVAISQWSESELRGISSSCSDSSHGKEQILNEGERLIAPTSGEIDNIAPPTGISPQYATTSSNLLTSEAQLEFVSEKPCRSVSPVIGAVHSLSPSEVCSLSGSNRIPVVLTDTGSSGNFPFKSFLSSMEDDSDYSDLTLLARVSLKFSEMADFESKFLACDEVSNDSPDLDVPVALPSDVVGRRPLNGLGHVLETPFVMDMASRVKLRARKYSSTSVVVDHNATTATTPVASIPEVCSPVTAVIATLADVHKDDLSSDPFQGKLRLPSGLAKSINPIHATEGMSSAAKVLKALSARKYLDHAKGIEEKRIAACPKWLLATVPSMLESPKRSPSPKVAHSPSNFSPTRSCKPLHVKASRNLNSRLLKINEVRRDLLAKKLLKLKRSEQFVETSVVAKSMSKQPEASFVGDRISSEKPIVDQANHVTKEFRICVESIDWRSVNLMLAKGVGKCVSTQSRKKKLQSTKLTLGNKSIRRHVKAMACHRKELKDAFSMKEISSGPEKLRFGVDDCEVPLKASLMGPFKTDRALDERAKSTSEETFSTLRSVCLPGEGDGKLHSSLPAPLAQPGASAQGFALATSNARDARGISVRRREPSSLHGVYPSRENLLPARSAHLFDNSETSKDLVEAPYEALAHHLDCRSSVSPVCTSEEPAADYDIDFTISRAPSLPLASEGLHSAFVSRPMPFGYEFEQGQEPTSTRSTDFKELNIDRYEPGRKVSASCGCASSFDVAPVSVMAPCSACTRRNLASCGGPHPMVSVVDPRSSLVNSALDTHDYSLLHRDAVTGNLRDKPHNILPGKSAKPECAPSVACGVNRLHDCSLFKEGLLPQQLIRTNAIDAVVRCSLQVSDKASPVSDVHGDERVDESPVNIRFSAISRESSQGLSDFTCNERSSPEHRIALKSPRPSSLTTDGCDVSNYSGLTHVGQGSSVRSPGENPRSSACDVLSVMGNLSLSGPCSQPTRVDRLSPLRAPSSWTRTLLRTPDKSVINGSADGVAQSSCQNFERLASEFSAVGKGEAVVQNKPRRRSLLLSADKKKSQSRLGQLLRTLLKSPSVREGSIHRPVKRLSECFYSCESNIVSRGAFSRSRKRAFSECPSRRISRDASPNENLADITELCDEGVSLVGSLDDESSYDAVSDDESREVFQPARSLLTGNERARLTQRFPLKHFTVDAVRLDLESAHRLIQLCRHRVNWHSPELLKKAGLSAYDCERLHLKSLRCATSDKGKYCLRRFIKKKESFQPVGAGALSRSQELDFLKSDETRQKELFRRQRVKERKRRDLESIRRSLARINRVLAIQSAFWDLALK